MLDAPRLPFSIEYLCVIVVLLLFLSLQANAIAKGNYAAQDFWHHYNMIASSAQDLSANFKVNIGTPFTLYHFIGGRIYNLVGEPHAKYAIATFNALANTLALFLFYVLIRRLIGSVLVRLSCFIFICFLPVVVITSGVIATEAFTPLLFISIIWALILTIERLSQGKNAMGWMIAGMALLILIFGVKFIYGLCVLGVALLGLILAWCRILEGKSFLNFLMLVIIPALAGIMMYFAFIHTQAIIVNAWQPMTYWAREVAGGQQMVLPEERMKFQNLILLKARDLELLDAPYFHISEIKDGQAFSPVLQTNYYSYPALTHTAIFTDFLNIYQPIRMSSDAPGVVDEYYTRIRPPENQAKMRWAVRSGVVFTLFMLIAVGWLICRMVYLIKRRGLTKEDVPVVVLLVLSLTVFTGFFLGLPFTHFTYTTGVWLPRHIMPVIISFGIISFVVLDRWLVNQPHWISWLIFSLVLLQSVLHISFLWVA